MKRASTVWGIYVALLVVMTGAMAWVTQRTLALEREERLTALRAENERLALWRMESVLLPFVSSESSRDYSEWGQTKWMNSDYPRKGFSPDEIPFRDDVVSVRFGSPFVIDYFRCDSDGIFVTGGSITDLNDNLNSPNAGLIYTANATNVKNAEWPPRWLGIVADEEAKQKLFQQTRRAREAGPPSTTLRRTWPAPEPQQFQQVSQAEVQLPAQLAEVQSQTLSLTPAQQKARNNYEFQQRMANTTNNGGNFISQSAIDQGYRNTLGFAPPGQAGAGPMTAVWLDEELVLARHVSGQGSWEAVEGCLLNQPAIQSALLAEVTDMFPNARIEPVRDGSVDNPLALASLPLKLIGGEMPVVESVGWSPMSTSFAIAWGWLSLCALAVGILLFGVVQLSERRAAFVSAVTHELRTPLTTFRLYSDLLADRDSLTEERHETYATTLQSESERLGHLVENVLSWSRLDQTVGPEMIEQVSWDDQMTRSLPALERRTAQAEMELRVESVEPVQFEANQTAVDQILFNLVDNSCKYASQADDKRIQVSADRRGDRAVIRVRDFGPGLNGQAKQRLFQPFSKSATAAAKSAPGVGLGLSLCRRLARSMNGELKHVADPSGGTTIELTLPAVGP